MAKRRSRADRRRSALKGWRTRRRNERDQPKRSRLVSHSPARRTAVGEGKRGGKTHPSSRKSKEFQRRSAAAKLGWKRRRRREKDQRGSKRFVTSTHVEGAARKAAPANREYFVVLLFKTRTKGKEQTRRLREAIVTLPDGASDEEIKKAYAQWMLENSNYSAEDIYRLVFAHNRGRSIDMRIVPRDEPSAGPAGAVRDNDARNPARKSVAPGKKTTAKRSRKKSR